MLITAGQLVNAQDFSSLPEEQMESILQGEEEKQNTDGQEATPELPGLYDTTSGILEVEEGEEDSFTFNMKNVPLQDFLHLVSAKTNKRFMVRPAARDVQITAFLPDVNLQTALDAIFAIHGLHADELGSDIIVVRKEDAEVTPDLKMELIKLDYLEAEDVKETMEPFLSPKGKIQIVKRTGYTGWTFGKMESSSSGSELTAREKRSQERRKEIGSQQLIIYDTPQNVAHLTETIRQLDRRPDQVLISARIVEVNHGDLRDIGVDYGINQVGPDSSSSTFIGSNVAPGNFDPEADIDGTYPFNSGMSLLFNKIGGHDYQILIHALEEEANANILSSPRILTLDNQECTILVGTKFPILETDVSGTETAQITTSLDYYENIGIQLNVIPQIQENDFINMIIHPAVSEQTGSVQSRGTGGEMLAEYPIIDAREAETQVLIQDGQTIVIGGLIKEIDTKNVLGVPLLKDIPVLGYLFRRTTTNKEKVDLLIFLTAHIIREPDESTEEKFRQEEDEKTGDDESSATKPEEEEEEEQKEPQEPEKTSQEEASSEEDSTPAMVPVQKSERVDAQQQKVTEARNLLVAAVDALNCSNLEDARQHLDQAANMDVLNDNVELKKRLQTLEKRYNRLASNARASMENASQILVTAEELIDKFKIGYASSLLDILQNSTLYEVKKGLKENTDNLADHLETTRQKLINSRQHTQVPLAQVDVEIDSKNFAKAAEILATAKDTLAGQFDPQTQEQIAQRQRALAHAKKLYHEEKQKVESLLAQSREAILVWDFRSASQYIEEARAMDPTQKNAEYRERVERLEEELTKTRKSLLDNIREVNTKIDQAEKRLSRWEAEEAEKLLDEINKTPFPKINDTIGKKVNKLARELKSIRSKKRNQKKQAGRLLVEASRAIQAHEFKDAQNCLRAIESLEIYQFDPHIQKAVNDKYALMKQTLEQWGAQAFPTQ
jgi:type IV pilus secretin PilQ/predicted competence protein